MDLAEAQEILHQLGVPRIEEEPEFSQLPNDLIMKIIRMADGGRKAHEKQFAEVMLDISDSRRYADEYIENNYGIYSNYFDDACEADDEEWFDMLSQERNWDEWEYSYWVGLQMGMIKPCAV